MNADVMGNVLRVFLVGLLATGMMACGEIDEAENQAPENQEEEEVQEESIEVEGTWDTPFGTTEVIDDERWDFMDLIVFDNNERWAVTQNPDDSEYNPSLYNRLVWTPVEDDVFYYCYVDFALESVDEALNSEGEADENDLDGEGCGGFSWTQMTRQ